MKGKPLSVQLKYFQLKYNDKWDTITAVIHCSQMAVIWTGKPLRYVHYNEKGQVAYVTYYIRHTWFTVTFYLLNGEYGYWMELQ